MSDNLGSIILGMGEVGSAHYRILSDVYPAWGVDKVIELNKTNQDTATPPVGQILHVCIRYSETFTEAVNQAIKDYQPMALNICSTVPCGTTESFSENACHSTTRGLHPNLEVGLRTIKKHVGGGAAPQMKDYFQAAGIFCEIHLKSRTTELLHILNNSHYGINLMFADEAAKLCRLYGVDYYDYMKYTESNNAGYRAIGHATKVRPILTPPNGKIGGHCVNMSAGLIPDDLKTPLIAELSKYGN